MSHMKMTCMKMIHMKMTRMSPRTLLSAFFLALLLAFLPGVPALAQSGTCGGDTNGDGVVNAADLAQVLTQWGTCPAVINSVTPNQGGFLGGTVITITGANLTSTYEVTVGGASCTNVAVLSPTSVRATTPAGSPGPASIAVRTLAGTTLASAPFTYLQSSISSVVPSLGIYTGGTAITITGTNLSGATSVTVGGVPATNVVAVSSTTVTAVTPAGSVGAVDVTVSGPKNTATAAGGFAYFSQVTPSWATLVEAFPDPAVVTDATLRAAITASGFAWRVRDNGTGIEMLLVPPGIFQMGCIMGSDSYGCYSWEQPVHTVTLTNAYYLGRYEVTQAQWQAKMGSNPSSFQGQSDSPSRPVEQVSWNMIQNFLSATGLRLPSEAEWEFACRAGTTTPFHSGPGFPNGTTNDGLVGTIAWFNCDGGCNTHAVGMKAANALGLHDMLGNVWEWQSDWYGDYTSSAQTNPTGPGSGSFRVLRGGAWYDNAGFVRSSSRIDGTPGDSNYVIGFRVARAPS